MQKETILLKEINQTLKTKTALLLVRHPNQAGNRDFIYLENQAQFEQWKEKLTLGDSVTWFLHPQCYFKGIYTTKVPIKWPPSQDLLVIEQSSAEWDYCSTPQDLLEYQGEEITVWLDPLASEDVFQGSSTSTKHAYIGGAGGSY